MYIELSPDERLYLDKILSRYLSEISHEISYTDTREFRQRLKNEAEILRVLQSKLAQEQDSDVAVGLA